MDGDRRMLLKGAGTLAAATLARPLSAQARGRKLGYAIVGLGGYGQRIMSQIGGCEHSRLTALVSGSPEKAQRLADEYQVPRKNIYNYKNFDTIRDNPEVDIVYVVLPNSMHHEYVLRAAKAGKHVMCEKPMAISAQECREMVAACKAAGRKLMIGYRSRFEPYNRLAIELVRKQEVGPTKLVMAEHGFDAKPNQWRLDRALSGGGSMMDIGIYSLNAARYLTGEEPVSVSAMEMTDRADPRFRTVEDRILFQLRFPSGVLADCTSSYSSNHNRYRISGTKGWIELEPATSYDGQKMRVKTEGEPRERTARADKTQFAGQLDHLSECILDGRDPIASGEDGLRDLVLIEAIYRAARERRTVTL